MANSNKNDESNDKKIRRKKKKKAKGYQPVDRDNQFDGLFTAEFHRYTIDTANFKQLPVVDTRMLVTIMKDMDLYVTLTGPINAGHVIRICEHGFEWVERQKVIKDDIQIEDWVKVEPKISYMKAIRVPIFESLGYSFSLKRNERWNPSSEHPKYLVIVR